MNKTTKLICWIVGIVAFLSGVAVAFCLWKKKHEGCCCDCNSEDCDSCECDCSCGETSAA